MPIDDSIAYEAVALHLELAEGTLSEEDYLADLNALVDDVDGSDDVQGLLIRLGSVAAVALEIACRAGGLDARTVLRDAAEAQRITLGGDERDDDA